MEPTERAEYLWSGSEPQMVRVPEDDLRARRGDLARGERLDAPLRPHGHERRRRHAATRSRKRAGARVHED